MRHIVPDVSLSGVDRRRKFERREKWDRKVENEIFDHSTMLVLSKLMSDGFFDYVDFPIASGKESRVFRARKGRKNVAIKIYPTKTFKKMSEYIDGDPRFKGVKGREMVFTWARKEFTNLTEIRKAAVRAPLPITVRKNVLVMGYIGSEIRPAPSLKNYPMDADQAEVFFHRVMGYVRKMYAAGIVHGDLSEYNILVWRGPVIIDVGQAVSVKHPRAQEFLKRDIYNIAKFFSRLIHIGDGELEI